MSAIHTGQAKIVAALVAKGADMHRKSSSGATALDAAKSGGKPEVIEPIQAALDKDAAYAASLRTPERFKDIIGQYTYQSCIYQYWNYVLLSHQEPQKQDELEKKTAIVKGSLMGLAKQIQLYYPTTKSEDLQAASNAAAQNIYAELDGMISNRNRSAKGVGSDADAASRCRAISDKLPINFLPQGMNN